MFLNTARDVLCVSSQFDIIRNECEIRQIRLEDYKKNRILNIIMIIHMARRCSN